MRVVYCLLYSFCLRNPQPPRSTRTYTLFPYPTLFRSKTHNDDILVATGSMADYDYSVNKDGTPEIRLLPGSGVNYADGGLANPHNYWLPFIQAHLEDNDAEELALKADVDSELEGSDWIDSLKVGVPYLDSANKSRLSSFNLTPNTA